MSGILCDATINHQKKNKEINIKKLLTGLLLLGTISSFAETAVECSLENSRITVQTLGKKMLISRDKKILVWIEPLNPTEIRTVRIEIYQHNKNKNYIKRSEAEVFISEDNHYETSIKIEEKDYDLLCI